MSAALHLTAKPELFLEAVRLHPEVYRHIIVETMDEEGETFAMPWNSVRSHVFWSEVEKQGLRTSSDSIEETNSQNYSISIVGRMKDIDKSEKISHVYDLSGLWFLCPGKTRREWFEENLRDMILDDAVLYTTFLSYMNNWMTNCAMLKPVVGMKEVQRAVILR